MSTSHLILLFLILMLVFGPSRLEGLGTSLGKLFAALKKGLEEGSAPEATQQSSTPIAPKEQKADA